MIESESRFRGAFYGLILSAFTLCPLILLPVRYSYVVPRASFMQVMITLALAIAWSCGIFHLRRSPFFIPWTLMLLVFFLSAFNAPHFFMGWKTFYLFAVLATLCAAVPFFHSIRKNPLPVFSAILIPGFLNAFYCIAQFHGWEFDFVKGIEFNTFGTLGSPAMLAGWLSICGIISLHFFSTPKNITYKLLGSAGLLLFTSTIILTRSRTGILSLSVGILSYFLISYIASVKSSKTILKNFTAAMLAVLIAAGGSFFLSSFSGTGNLKSRIDFIKSNFFESEKSGSILQRQLIWSAASNLIYDRPLTGHGIGSFAYMYPLAQAHVLSRNDSFNRFHNIAKQRVASYAHNDYLQIASETGIPGLSAFLLFPLIAGISFSRSIRKRDPFAVTHGAAAAAVISSIGIQAMFDFPLYMPASALCGWFFLGLLASPVETAPARFSPRPAPFRLAAFSAATLFCFISILPLASVILLSESSRCISRKDFQGAAVLLAAANRFDPAEPEIHAELGRLKRSSGKLREAVGHYNDALKISNHPSYYYGRGICEYMLSDLEAAEADFSTILKIDPSSAAAAGALGVIYMDMGKYSPARAMFDRLRYLRPGDTTSVKYLNLIDQIEREKPFTN